MPPASPSPPAPISSPALAGCGPSACRRRARCTSAPATATAAATPPPPTTAFWCSKTAPTWPPPPAPASRARLRGIAQPRPAAGHRAAARPGHPPHRARPAGPHGAQPCAPPASTPAGPDRPAPRHLLGAGRRGGRQRHPQAGGRVSEQLRCETVAPSRKRLHQ